MNFIEFYHCQIECWLTNWLNRSERQETFLYILIFHLRSYIQVFPGNKALDATEGDYDIPMLDLENHIFNSNFGITIIEKYIWKFLD